MVEVVVIKVLLRVANLVLLMVTSLVVGWAGSYIAVNVLVSLYEALIGRSIGFAGLTIAGLFPLIVLVGSAAVFWLLRRRNH